MRWLKRPDTWVALLVVALCAWAVAAQVQDDPVGAAVARRGPSKLEVGQPLEDQEVTNIAGTPLRLHALLGAKATVFYAWSVECPCVEQVDERLLPLVRQWKPQGVAFLAVAGDGRDTREEIAAKLQASWSRTVDGAPRTPMGLPPYGVLHDPTQRLCKQLGFREAVQFVIVDANAQVRYRGTFDNDLKKPTTAWLPGALDDVVAGRPVAVPLRPVSGYGCPFGIPVQDCPEDLPGAAPPVR
ncbi:MAG: redoxin domain-containing protein [Planctomycetia bacterium]